MKKYKRACLLAGTAATLMTVWSAAHAQTGEDAPEAETRRLNQVVVTALRREETLKDTPIAVSAYDGEQLGRERVEDFADIALQSPNVQFGANGGNTNIAIRGIGTNLQTAGNDPGVAFNLDGIYVADPALALSTLLDVKRVEVLRGPQGTLFGRNATGGAVNVISNTPTTTASYGFNTSVSAPLGVQADAFASGPLVDSGKLLGRIAVQKIYREGDVENTASTGPDHLNDQDSLSARAQLEWRPTSTLSARLQADYQDADTAGPAYYLAGTPNTGLGLPAQLASTFIGGLDDDEIAVTAGSSKLMQRNLALFVDWDLGPGSLRATLSTRHSENDRFYDGDGTEVEYTSTRVDQSRDTDFFELLYSSDGDGPFSYILGANYINDQQVQIVEVPVLFFPAPVILTGDVDTEAYAVFGRATYEVTDHWSVFGGARYSSDRKSMDESNNFIGTDSKRDEWSKPTYEIGTSLDIGQNSTAYLKYATGYKSGGYASGSLQSAFDPETNSMWELGLKGTYLDGTLNANLALFHMAYEDLQVNQVVGVSSVVTNAAEATINGVELELVQQVTPEFSFIFNGGWLDATFDEFLTEDSARPQLGPLSLAGNDLPNAPAYTLSFGPAYERDLSGGGRLSLSARYDWRSEVYFSEFNLPLVSEDSSGRLNAFANYEFPDGKWQIGLYGRNLTDERTYSSMVVASAVLNSIAMATANPGREVGIRLSFRH